MKNSFFNIIRGVAFCFVLSIIFIFGRVDVKADTLSDSFALLDLPTDNFLVSYHSNIDRFYLYKYSSNTDLIARDSGDMLNFFSNDSNSITIERYYCTRGHSSWTYDDTFYGNHAFSFYPHIKDYICYSSNDIYFENGSKFTDYLIEIPNDFSHDTSLGYLSDVVVKRGSSMMLTALDTDITNIIDRYSWSASTSSGETLDGVDVKIIFYRNEDKVVEKELHLGCPPNEYYFDWSNFVELNLKDWLVGSLYRYEIFLRPTKGNFYGDYCYFNVNFPSSALEQMTGTFDPTYLTDDIQYCPSVGNVDDFNTFNRPEKTTPIYVPHYVTNNRPAADIKDDLKNDDKVPQSSPSYNTVINNINNVVNNYDDDTGNSLIESISDLLGFFKNFLSFIALFITSVLSNFTFIPTWVINLIKGTILAFIVISIIKTVLN